MLGNRQFPINIIQGPLAGVSAPPFRSLTWRYGKPAFSCTEMISCKTLMHKSMELQRRYVEKDAAEGPVCFQLSGNNVHDIAEAVKRVTDLGADLIDLNCGCPVKKIRSKGAGSSLLLDTPRLYQLIRAMKENTTVPVSIKIRVEGGSGDRFNQEVADVVRDGGADFLVVHGRHWTEHYETPCHHDDIQFFVEQLKIPVIGNGDVRCVESLKKMLATGCSGVMIGRAGVGQPWLIQQLVADYQGVPFTLPALSEIGLMFVEHVERLAELLGSARFAMLQARKFAKYYGRQLDEKTAFCIEVNGCEDIPKFRAICEQYFQLEQSVIPSM